ncbi:MAG: GNAT family N-acetyltransferase [Dehalococcoidia bacterium]|nr:MAG: GNAT family N-acetyltransferase [Dehalococcoidia bacterium]
MLTDRLKESIFGPRTAAKQRAQYVVERLVNPEVIRPLLEGQRTYVAYALAHLDPRLFPRSEWWHAHGPQGQALLVHSRSGLGPALVALGDPQALDALCRVHPGPRLTFATFQLDHLAVAQRHFVLSRPGPSLRMSVSAASFQPIAGPAQRLHRADIGAVNALQHSEGLGSYPAAVLVNGVYYGVYADQRLVAMAGTHVVAPSQRLALVGNIMTHPRYRGQGYGSVATSAVTAELLKTCPDVLLTVDARNEVAIRLYERLGYREECRLIESGARRKDMIGLVALVRRALARRRAEDGREIVLLNYQAEGKASEGGQ